MSRRRSRRIRIDKDDAEFAEDGWFSVPRKAIRDPVMSPAARWAYAWMLANETGFYTTAEDIAQAGGIGIHAAEDLIYEVEAAGYLLRTYTRNGRGHIDGIDYKLKALPVPEAQRTAKPRKPRKKRSSFPRPWTTSTTPARPRSKPPLPARKAPSLDMREGGLPVCAAQDSSPYIRSRAFPQVTPHLRTSGLRPPGDQGFRRSGLVSA
jgi:hypothetical protein